MVVGFHLDHFIASPYTLAFRVCDFWGNMAFEILKQLLQGNINRMYDENDVDHQFDKFGVYGSVEKANEFLKQVESFCLEVDREISELESYSKLPKINFLEAIRIARSVKARSIWMGAHNMKRAVFFVIDACLGFQEERYSSAVISLRNEFNPSRFKIETYVKMVVELMEKENKLKEQKQ